MGVNLASGGQWYVKTASGLAACGPQIATVSGWSPINTPVNTPVNTGGGGSTGGGVNTVALVLSEMQTAGEDSFGGTPAGFSWKFGPVDGNATPPFVNVPPITQCSSGLPWFQMGFGAAGPGTDTNVRVQVRMLELYCWSTSRARWLVAAQKNSLSVFNGYEYPEDFGSGSTPAANVKDETGNGGGISFLLSRTLTTGSFGQGSIHCCIHGYSNSRSDLNSIGAASLSDIGAMFTTVQYRLILNNPAGVDDRAQSNYVGNVGCDFWLNQTALFNASQNTNPGSGQGQMRKIPHDGSWQACNFWNGPNGFTPTWANGTRFNVGLTAAQMSAVPPPLNAMGA